MGNTPKVKKTAERRPSRPAADGTGRPTWLKWTIGVLGFGALALFVWYISQDVAGSPQGQTEPPPGTETFVIGDVGHTSDPVAYEQIPPVGGSHDPEWLTCGVYDQAVRNENAVHALEHGAVWITYQPGISDDDRSRLEGFGRNSEVIVSPYPGIDTPVVVSAWGRQLKLQTADRDLIDQFIRAFKNRTAPENNASC